MNGWMDGRKSRFKDCLQQSKRKKEKYRETERKAKREKKDLSYKLNKNAFKRKKAVEKATKEFKKSNPKS